MSNQALQSLLMGYSEKGKTSLLSPGSGSQLEIFELGLHNRSGGAINVGLCVKLNSSSYKVYQIDASATPDAVEVTTAIQGGTATDIFTTTNNDGFMVQADRPFNVIGLNISQAETASPTYAYTYYDGSAMSSVSTIDVPSAYSTGTQLIVVNPDIDWAVGTTSAVGGDSSLYAIQAVATTAGGQAVQADDIWVGYFVRFEEALADNGKLTFTSPANEALVLDGSEGVFPYFGTASAANQARVVYKTRG